MNSRREVEKKVFDKMTAIYCKGNGHGEAPCSRCCEIMDYAHSRIDSCMFGDEKKFCSSCTVHCFEPGIRAEVKRIMRYSGPRMIFHHPVMAVRHLLSR